jgi:hypothetical protein
MQKQLLDKVCRIKNDSANLIIVPTDISFCGLYVCRVYIGANKFRETDFEPGWMKFHPDELEPLPKRVLLEITLTKNELRATSH